jgi:hypothetical protein
MPGHHSTHVDIRRSALGGDDMIWAILIFLGVPLWVCAAGIFTVIHRNRALRNRPGNVPVRVLKSGSTRWTRGHGLWISDVFAWRGSPAAWSEGLMHVVALDIAAAEPAEQKRLPRLGDAPVVATMTTAEQATVKVAVAGENRSAVLGPFPSVPLDSLSQREAGLVQGKGG